MKNKNIDTKNVNEVISLGKKILKILYIFLIIGAIFVAFQFCKQFGIFAFIKTLLKVLAPLFIGFVIAWLFNPIVTKLKKKGINRIIATIIVYVIFIALLFVFIRIFIPVLYEQINEFVKMAPNIVDSVSDFISNVFNKLSGHNIDLTSVKETLIGQLSGYVSSVTGNLPNTLLNTVLRLFSGIGTVGISLIIGLYMLFDFDNIVNHITKLIPKKHKEEVMGLLDDIGIQVRKSVNGTLLVACMVFVCDTIGFSIIGLNGALLFGLFCGITDLIPYIGPYIGTGVAAIVGFTQNPIIGLGVLIIAIVVQIIESYILQPIIMSKTTQIHPVIIILGLLVFGHFFGIIGMILATPILSIFKVILNFALGKYKNYTKKKKPAIE